MVTNKSVFDKILNMKRTNFNREGETGAFMIAFIVGVALALFIVFKLGISGELFSFTQNNSNSSVCVLVSQVVSSPNGGASGILSGKNFYILPESEVSIIKSGETVCGTILNGGDLNNVVVKE